MLCGGEGLDVACGLGLGGVCELWVSCFGVAVGPLVSSIGWPVTFVGRLL